jgi:hypothetical protein
VTGSAPLRPFRDSSLNALMLSAAAEIRSCREVIREAGPEMAGDLKAFAASLDSLSHAIDSAAMLATFGDLSPNPVPSHIAGRGAAPKPKRHLQVVGGAR